MGNPTYNFGPLVVLAANFAVLLDGPSDISKITLSGYKTHILRVTCIFRINSIEFDPYYPLRNANQNVTDKAAIKDTKQF